MALQTKTYTATNNGFTLELTLVENSTSTSANTSSIGYTLKLKSTSKDFPSIVLVLRWCWMGKRWPLVTAILPHRSALVHMPV